MYVFTKWYQVSDKVVFVSNFFIVTNKALVFSILGCISVSKSMFCVIQTRKYLNFLTIYLLPYYHIKCKCSKKGKDGKIVLTYTGNQITNSKYNKNRF